MSEIFIISGQIVDVFNRRQFSGNIHVSDGKILQVEETGNFSGPYILPGFIDAHIHIESSMLVPSEFARIAVKHGTVATVSDPHEIANVLGTEGVMFMIENGEHVNFKFNFGAPSCVPATAFETAGAVLDSHAIEELLSDPRVKYLSEMMNWPGVLARDPVVMEKIKVAKNFNKPVDGHAPGLMGEDAKHYISTGITTDHECFTYEEGLHKIQSGMKVIIREGSAAKNFNELYPLLKQFPDQIMFCSDDKHPHELVEGHINQLVARAVANGSDLFDVLQAACVNPILHYNLDVGYLQKDHSADFILVDDLKSFSVTTTYINGAPVYQEGECKIDSVSVEPINQFNREVITNGQIQLKHKGFPFRVIVAEDHQLITKEEHFDIPKQNGLAVSDPSRDLLKIVVVNRYQNVDPTVGFIHNFGLQTGAIASSVAHDSHNIIAVGVEDEWIIEAVNAIIAEKGGISVAAPGISEILSLPVAGLMSTEDGIVTAEQYVKLDRLAKGLGSELDSPFMTLSFMALLVIPKLKLSDKGLFDGETFEFVNTQIY